jgi:SAM-dependent methyltransferase
MTGFPGPDNELNWDQMWRDKLDHSSWCCTAGKEKWAKRAELHNDRLLLGCYDDYVKKVVSEIVLSNNETVLDLGCGPGTLSATLASRAKSVTCLDISKRMLRFAQQNAALAGAKNISFIERDWEEVEVNEDITIHDVVIASRWIGHELKNNLVKIDAAARSRAYIIWGTGIDAVDREVCQLLGREYIPHPGYIYIYNQLFQLGIYARVKIFKCSHPYIYRDLISAIDDWRWGMHPITRRKEEKLVEYLLSNRDENTGTITLGQKEKATWAIISWQKKECWQI